MRFLRTFLLLILSTLLLLPACTKDGNTIVIEDEPPADTRPVVYFLAREGDMGDQGFVDRLYKGVIGAVQSNNMLCSTFELPKDSMATEMVIVGLLESMRMTNENRRYLFVVVNDNLEQVFHRYADYIKGLSNIDILLTESNDTTLPVHTLSFNGYGICYQAAQVVAAGMPDVMNTLVFSANPNSKELDEMRQGFQQGIDDYVASDSSRLLGADYSYLSETNGGYNDADSLYKLCYFVNRYDLVLPLCGGSINGLFRYNRENPESFYTIGMDVNQQQYSTNVPFSICKYIDGAIEEWVARWRKGEELPMHLRYRLDSGYLSIEVSEEYEEQFLDVVYESYAKAVEKEQEYENKSNQ